jgi:hypothetical protein
MRTKKVFAINWQDEKVRVTVEFTKKDSYLKEFKEAKAQLLNAIAKALRECYDYEDIKLR